MKYTEGASQFQSQPPPPNSSPLFTPFAIALPFGYIFDVHSSHKKNPMKQKPTLYLLDGMALAYRSYFAFIRNPLINSKGENTSAVFGFVNYLNKILDEKKPDYIAVVFDTIEPTFRHKEYPEYKATRQKMPEDMSAMMGRLKDVVQAYNVPVVELPGFEADDVIGTLAKRAEKENVDTFLVTSDKDFMQLVTKNVKLYRPGKGGGDDEIIDEKGVVEKFGVPPEQVIEILGLIGDSSDNVPGVAGVGPKTAEPLIKKYGTIENLLKHIDDIPQKGLQEKLKTHKEMALLSKKLVTIDVNAPVTIDFHKLKANEKNVPALLQLFTDLEFRSLARRLKENEPAESEPENVPLEISPLNDISAPGHLYIVIDSNAKYLRFLSELKRAKEFVFDTETTSTDALQAEIVGISFCFEPHTAYYVPIATEPAPGDDQSTLFGAQPTAKKKSAETRFELKRVIRDLKPVFENESVRKYGQNIKYDMLALSRKGIWTRGGAFDTMVASYILRADGQHNLDSLAKEYLNYKMVSFDELTGTGKQRKDIRDIPAAAVGAYSAEDADVTFQLVNILHDKLAVQGMKSLCENVEFPLI